MDYNWKNLAESQLRVNQILTNEIDKLKIENNNLIHELEISNNSIKALLNEQEQIIDKLAILSNTVENNPTTVSFKQEIVTQPDLFKELDKQNNESYIVKPKKKFNCPNGHPKLRKLTNAQVHQIRGLELQGLTKAKISYTLDIPHGIVNAILAGRTYKNV